MIELRDYQMAAVDALFAYFERAAGNPLVVLPTGSGKSLCIAEFCRRALAEHPETRILIATHRAELIEQDAGAIRALWPDAPVGVYSAGLGMRQIRPITVAGVQSIVHVEGLPAFDLVIVDECHLCPFDGDGYYRQLFARLEALNPEVKRIGFTATPYRLNGGRLTRGKRKVFTSIAYEKPVQELVDAGYLAPLVTPSKNGASFNTSKVGTNAGDFKIGELASTVEAQSAVTRAALDEALRVCGLRESWLVYCVSIEHARQAAEYLFSLGIGAHVVTGEDDRGDRRRKIAAFKAGETRVLVSCDILTTGFDAPRVDCIVLLRPTQSTGLYVQICGRGMRLSAATGKVDCAVLDYGQNIQRHGPITAVKPKETREATGDAKIKDCPKCDAEIASWKRVCPECGFIFLTVPRAIDHDDKASTRAIMGPPPPPDWIAVTEVAYDRWDKRPEEGQPPPIPTMRVRYLTGNLAKRDYSEWVCLEHGGFAKQKADRWWRDHGGIRPAPNTIDEALTRAHELKDVEAITVEPDGKYTRVKLVRYKAPREPGSDDDLDATTPDSFTLFDYGEHAEMIDELDDEDLCPF